MSGQVGPLSFVFLANCEADCMGMEQNVVLIILGGVISRLVCPGSYCRGSDWEEKVVLTLCIIVQAECKSCPSGRSSKGSA